VENFGYNVYKILGNKVAYLGSGALWYNAFLYIVNAHTAYVGSGYPGTPRINIYKFSDLQLSKSLVSYDSLNVTVTDTIMGMPLCSNLTELVYKDSNLTDTILFDIIDSTLSINKFNNASEWNIFPNPASSKITVNSDRQTVYSIEIYNMFGEKIYRSPITDYRLPFTINISSFPTTMYFVEIKS
jgi:hypothetical protein